MLYTTQYIVVIHQQAWITLIQSYFDFGKCCFFSSSGPKDKTVIDFWRLVWEKNVRVIVMITKCVELGKRKCSQYWPETSDPSEGVRHGHVTVQLVKTVNGTTEGYDVHTLKVSSMVSGQVYPEEIHIFNQAACVYSSFFMHGSW